MRGVNPVPDFLDTVAGVLTDERDFTSRAPVYMIDPEGALFSIEHARNVAVTRALDVDIPPIEKDLNWGARYARARFERAIALRLNPFIRVFLQFRDAAVESLNRVARAERALEETVRRNAQRASRREDELESRIAKLEAEIARLTKQSGDGGRR